MKKKDNEAGKTLTINREVHAVLKIHCAIKGINIGEFVERAIRNQIKREKQ